MEFGRSPPEGSVWHVTYLTLHGLRHTHATHLLAIGENPRVVSERLGHADVAFTLQVYGHVLPGHQRQAAEAAAGLLKSGADEV